MVQGEWEVTVICLQFQRKELGSERGGNKNVYMQGMQVELRRTREEQNHPESSLESEKINITYQSRGMISDDVVMRGEGRGGEGEGRGCKLLM